MTSAAPATMAMALHEGPLTDALCMGEVEADADQKQEGRGNAPRKQHPARFAPSSLQSRSRKIPGPRAKW